MPRRPRASASTSARPRRPDIHFPVAYVRYYDHCWLQSKEIEHIDAAQPYVVEETGFLLKETPEYITLAKERSTDGEKGKTTFDDVTILMRSDIIDLQIFPLVLNGHKKKASKKPGATKNGARSAKSTKGKARARSRK